MTVNPRPHVPFAIASRTILALMLALTATLALWLGSVSVSQAAVIASYEHDYGSRGSTRVAPDQYGTLNNNHVVVSSSWFWTTDFADTINLTGLPTTASISSIEVELEYNQSSSSGEDWYALISGGGGSATSALLNDSFSPQIITLLPGMDAFATAVANLRIDFTFIDPDASETDDFKLYSAVVRVNGSLTAAVPLPASVLLLLTGLAAMGGWGRVVRRSG